MNLMETGAALGPAGPLWRLYQSLAKVWIVTDFDAAR